MMRRNQSLVWKTLCSMGRLCGPVYIPCHHSDELSAEIKDRKDEGYDENGSE
jgi:hypothetical protein